MSADWKVFKTNLRANIMDFGSPKAQRKKYKYLKGKQEIRGRMLITDKCLKSNHIQ